MALTGTDRGQGTHNTSSSTLTLSPASNFAAGMAVLCVSMDNPSSGNDISAVSDSIGNTWTIRQSPVVDPGAAAAGHQGIIATSPQDVGLLQTGTVITVTIGAAKVAKTWTLMQVSGSTGTPSYVTGGIGTGGTGTTSPTITTGTIPVGDMVVAMLALEAGTTQTITQDGDTTNGSWSTQQTAEIGSTTSGSNIASQRKVQTTTGSTQTYNPTLGLSGDLALAWIQITEVQPPTGSGGVSFTASLAGVGSLNFVGSSGGVAFGASLAGLGAWGFGGTGGVVFTASLGASGQLSFIANSGGVVFTASPAGVGQLRFIGTTGGVAFGASLAGVSQLRFISSGGVAFGASLAGVSALAFIASGGVSYGVILAGVGTHSALTPIVASGGVIFTGSLLGSGFNVFGNDRVGSGGIAFGGSFGSRGWILPPSGSNMKLLVAMIEYHIAYDLLTTDDERARLQRQFVGRWGVYPVRILIP